MINFCANISRREFVRLASMSGIASIAPTIFSGCGSGGSSSSLNQSISYQNTIVAAKSAINSELGLNRASSISVGLINSQGLIWSGVFGSPDKQSVQSLGSSTKYCIGSVSKMFATVATMILVDRGLVNLDTPLVNYVQDFTMASPEYTQITVRMLLNHSSGFQGSNYRNGFTFTPILGYANATKSALASERLKHMPGEMAVYCNDGFTMIEILIQAITGKSYVNFVNDEILTPLEMNNSAYATVIFPNATYAPTFDSTGNKTPLEVVNVYGSGGLYSTPMDMSKFAMILLNNGIYKGKRILSQSSIADINTNQTVNIPLYPTRECGQVQYGLGWDCVKDSSLEQAGVITQAKSGGTTYYHSQFLVAPSANLAVMICGAGLYNNWQVAELILLNACAESGVIPSLPSVTPAISKAQASPPSDIISAMVGCYANHTQYITVAANSDQTLTMIDYTDQNSPKTTILKYRVDGTFSSDETPLSSYYQLSQYGYDYIIVRMPSFYGNTVMEMPYVQRLTPKTIHPAWLNRKDTKWLIINDSALNAQYDPIINIIVTTGLDGYMSFNGQVLNCSQSATQATMCMKIPVDNSRDLFDASIQTINNIDYLLLSSSAYVYISLATIKTLISGANTITIGDNGYCEWRKIPSALNVTISNASAWKLFDQNFNLVNAGYIDVSFSVQAGYYLVVFGSANQNILVV